MGLPGAVLCLVFLGAPAAVVAVYFCGKAANAHWDEEGVLRLWRWGGYGLFFVALFSGWQVFRGD